MGLNAVSAESLNHNLEFIKISYICSRCVKENFAFEPNGFILV